MTLSEIFAAFICGNGNISDNDLYLAKRSIVDTVGATIAGSRTEVVHQTLPVYSMPGKSTVIGVGKGYAAHAAAFINGVSGHELELDDTCASNLGHPTVAVLPALLAVGEELGSSGEQLLKAFLYATEVECKIGRICAAELHRRGWHASSITGVVGAAAGCGYLYGQDEVTLRNTIGIAASMASGVRENFGTTTKSVHIGKTAGDGVIAAQLASQGVTASPRALEGHEGYLREYAGFDGMTFGEDFAAKLGNPFDIAAPGFALKKHPSCSSTHRAIDGLIDLIEENSLTADDIERIDVGLSQPALRELVTPYPKDGEEAKFSIGFQLALYLTGRDNMPYNYKPAVIFLPEIQRIINATFLYNEPTSDNLPSEMGVGPAHVSITKPDGTVLKKTRVFPEGHLTHPIPDEGIYDKYKKCTTGIISDKQADELYHRIMNLEKEPDIRAILDLCI